MEIDTNFDWLSSDLSTEITSKEEFLRIIPDIVKDIIGGKCSMTDLIERLAGVLTSKDPNHRANGTLVLSKVLHGFPALYLNQNELQVIVNFYIDRLKDHHSVIPAVVSGLVAISGMTNLSDEAAARIVTSLFREVPCQQQLRQDRHNIYTFIHNLLCNKPKDLISLGPDFVYGFISAIDGERDPRNLLLLFSILPHFLKTVPLLHLVEEMFEVMSCYFPIDFNASAKEPSAVTRENLANKLSPCLCAVPAFDQYCVPLALEKLDTSLRIAKYDSLKLLVESTKVFPARSYEPYLVHIWSMLQKEYLNKMDNELRHCASEVLTALLIVLSKDSEIKSLLQGFLQRILVSMEAVLVDATAKPIFDIPAMVYVTCANATKESCLYISESIFNSLLRFFNLNNDELLKVGALQCIMQMFYAIKGWDILSDMNFNFTSISEVGLSACQSLNDNLRLTGFLTMSSIAEVIPKEQLYIFYTLIKNSIDFETSSAVTSACRKCILDLSQYHASDILTLMIDKQSTVISPENKFFERRLLALCILILNDQLYAEVMEHIAYLLLVHSDSSLTTLKALKVVFEDKLMNSQRIIEIENKYNLVKLVLEWLITKPKDETDASLLRTSFLTLIIRNLSIEAQSELLLKNSSFFQIEENTSLYVIPLHALLVSIRSDVAIHNLHRLIQSLCNVALHDSDNFVRYKSCTLIANLLNKAYIREKNSDNFKVIYSKVDTILNNLIFDAKSITLLIWFTKGLVLCGHPNTEELIYKLATLLDVKDVGLDAANGFKIIMEDNDEDLSLNKCYCTVNFLYKQRVFEAFVKFSLAKQDYDLNNSGMNETFFLAWANICQSIPKPLLNRVPKLQSLIVESLCLTNVNLLLSTLSTALYLVQNKDVQFAHSLQTILPRLIELSHSNKSMKVRMDSLQIVYEIAENYSNVLLLPFKQDMIYEWLITQLDDRKRLVRNAAVKARARWFLIGSPGEEK